MVATLVLASRFRALPVLTGVSAAFAAQTAIAVAAGSLLSCRASGWRSASHCCSRRRSCAVALGRRGVSTGCARTRPLSDRREIASGRLSELRWRSSSEPSWSPGYRFGWSAAALRCCSPRSPAWRRTRPSPPAPRSCRAVPLPLGWLLRCRRGALVVGVGEYCVRFEDGHVPRWAHCGALIGDRLPGISADRELAHGRRDHLGVHQGQFWLDGEIRGAAGDAGPA